MSFKRKPKTINPDNEDPSVFLYDEVYDDMKNEEAAHKEDAARSRNQDKQGSKYIQGLLETAELRKTEKEIRKFKKYARDREDAEATGQLDHTDVYITSAYKKKLDEINRIDKEKRRRIDQEEDRMLNIHRKHGHSRDKDSKKVGRIDDHCDTNPTQESSKNLSQETKKSEEDEEHRKDERPPRRQLRTSEDRKHYLREVLAKRTVGQKYEDAKERFKQRKASYTSLI